MYFLTKIFCPLLVLFLCFGRLLAALNDINQRLFITIKDIQVIPLYQLTS